MLRSKWARSALKEWGNKEVKGWWIEQWVLKIAKEQNGSRDRLATNEAKGDRLPKEKHGELLVSISYHGWTRLPDPTTNTLSITDESTWFNHLHHWRANVFFLLLCKQKKKAFILFLDTQIIREMQSQMHYMIYNHFKLPLYIWLIVALLLPS